MSKLDETLIGTVQEVKPGKTWLYRKEDSLWTILNLLPDTSMKKCAVKGVIKFEPKHGDRLKLTGTWKKSDFNGAMEFHFRTCELNLPTSPRALLSYACTITKGLGPVREQEIWDRYGDTWPDQDLTSLDGISESVRYAWKDTLARLVEEQTKSQAVAFLVEHGCTLTVALKAWDRWEEETIGVIQDDPYKLADLPFCGFHTVEKGIRQSFGLHDTDPRRTKAAVLYVLESQLPSGPENNGGTWHEEGIVIKAASECLGHDAGIVQAIEALVAAGQVVSIEGGYAMKADAENEQAAMSLMETSWK